MLAHSAQAGVSSSGGGFAVVCRNSSNRITSAELLDLFEARLIQGLKPAPATGDLAKDFEASVRRTYTLQLGEPEVVKSWPTLSQYAKIEPFLDHVIWIQNDSDLPQINDLGSTAALSFLQSGCQIEQIALMQDPADQIFIRQDVWKAFDTANQAALIQHESFYKMSRNYVLVPDKTSEPIRKLVGLIFSVDHLEGVIDGMPTGCKMKTTFHDLNGNRTGRWDSTSYCQFETGTLINGIPVTRLQFADLGGRPALTKSFVDIPQRLNFSDKFYIQGRQFQGWYLIALPDEGIGSGVKFQVLDANGWIVTEILQR